MLNGYDLLIMLGIFAFLFCLFVLIFARILIKQHEREFYGATLRNTEAMLKEETEIDAKKLAAQLIAKRGKK